MFNVKNSLTRILVFPLLALIFFVVKQLMEESEERDILSSASIWFLFVFVFIVIRSYFRLKNAFYSNKKIQENISYTFTDENVLNKGETFEGEFGWDTVYKVKENKEWFLIYQTAHVMNMVPKKYFKKDQISGLRNTIRNNHVKAKLRND
ncbi:YcxB-like protein [Chryseobacterium geocarposphaerae]|uniref:YcxB-like protein n=2 Tax=Chryseobacterium geocarposphaerae TaxID=1416776 RepID=A0A2M9C9T2_9FLAO|nr:YcxB-like protein [Chryseobacterium geocarposphaerae]